MESQQLIISRVSQWFNQQRPIQPQNSQTTSSFLSISQQFKKLRHIPMSKLSLNNIFVKKENEKNLYKKELNPQKVKSQHHYFYGLRESFQTQISCFMAKYKFNDESTIAQDIKAESPAQLNMSNSESGRARGTAVKEQKMTSIEGKKRVVDMKSGSPVMQKTQSKKLNEGGYFFNNWRSYEKYYCEKAPNCRSNKESNDNLCANLVYAVIDMDYERGLRIIEKINENGNVKQIKANNQQSSSRIKVKDIIVESKHHKKNLGHHPNIKSQFYPDPAQQHSINSKSTSIHLTSLRIIIKGLRTLSAIIKLTDELNNNTQLSQTFFNRSKFDLFEDEYLNDPKAKMNLLNINVDQINNNELISEYWDGSSRTFLDDVQKDGKKFDKNPSYTTSQNSPKESSRKTLRSTQNLISYKTTSKKSKSTEQMKKFLQLLPKVQKICILTNLNFLIKFTAKVKISSCQNDYYKLLLCYIKNGSDQLQDVKMQYESYMQSPSRDGIKMSPYLMQDDDQCSNLSQSSMNNRQLIDLSKEIDYITLLLELKQLKIYDRINFATRLLPKNKKIKFVNLLQTTIVHFPFLDNLLIFTKFYKDQLHKILEESSSFHYLKDQKPKQQIKKTRKNSTDSSAKYYTQNQLQEKQKNLKRQAIQKKIKKKELLQRKIVSICQNFIDETGDLATIAYLSNEYPCLQKFCDYYCESLLLSYEQDEVQKINGMKDKLYGDQWVDKKSQPLKKCSPFLSQINFRQQKLNENPHEEGIEIESRKCEICSLKIFPDKKECYIECSKCRHGGHIEHLIKWYNSYQNCPNVNCACICN